MSKRRRQRFGEFLVISRRYQINDVASNFMIAGHRALLPPRKASPRGIKVVLHNWERERRCNINYREDAIAYKYSALFWLLRCLMKPCRDKEPAAPSASSPNIKPQARHNLHEHTAAMDAINNACNLFFVIASYFRYHYCLFSFRHDYIFTWMKSPALSLWRR